MFLIRKKAYNPFKADGFKISSPLHFTDEETKAHRGEVTCLKLLQVANKTKIKAQIYRFTV